MSKINPDDGMDVGTVVIVVDSKDSVPYDNGDYGTIIEDDGDDIPRVRLSDGEEYWMYLEEIRPKTLNDATPAEWDTASKVSLPFDMFYTSTGDSKFAYAGDTTSMLGETRRVTRAAEDFLEFGYTTASAARVHDGAYEEGKEPFQLDMFQTTEDVIDAPAHYNNGGIECIDYIRQQLGEEGYIAYCEGNMIKYQHRYKYKGGIEDLKKARKYQEWLIEALKAKEEIAMTEMTQRNL
jgi:hypothetical protein